MRLMGTWLAVAVVFTVVSLVGAFLFHEVSAVGPVGEAREIKGTNLEGRLMRLSAYRGKVVLLVFWRSAEGLTELHHALQQVRDKVGSEKLVVLGVNADPSFADGKMTSDQANLSFRSWHDGTRGPLARDWGVKEMPTLFLIDPAGRVRQRFGVDYLQEEIQWSARLLAAEIKKNKAP